MAPYSYSYTSTGQANFTPQATSYNIRDMADDVPLIRQDDIVIAVMGVTGVGKSTFISYFSPTAQPGEGLESFTTNVETHEAEVDDSRVVLIDTPGFDDTYRSDTDVLRELADWLTRSYQAKIKLAGIVYLHRIGDNRMGGAAMKNLRMFKKLVGEDRLSCVVLATTMWDLTAADKAVAREHELGIKEEFWAGMVRKGSLIFRQNDGPNSAVNILRYIVQQWRASPGGMTLKIQEEMASGKRLDQTEAGQELEAEMERMRARHEQEMAELRQDFIEAQERNKKEAQMEIREAKAELERKMKSEREDRERMRVDMEQLQRQRDEEIKRERERAHKRELEHMENFYKNRAELERIKAQSQADTTKLQEKVKAEKAKAEKYKKKVQLMKEPACTLM